MYFKSKNLIRISACILLSVMLIFSASGCSLLTFESHGDSNTDENKSNNSFPSASAGFSMELFQKCLNLKPGENTLISPLSVMCALSMTANGAKGETLAEMENVLGLDVESLNKYLKTYITSLKNSGKFNLANSVWIRDDNDSISVKKEFLQILEDYYGAQAFKSVFDEAAVKDINDWISDNTNGKINNMLDKISNDEVMFLINALTFESEWENTKWNDIRSGLFTTESGEKLDAEFMHYEGQYKYIDDSEGGAKGIIKNYEGGQYSFVALLPDEGKNVSDYAATLTGDRFVSLLKGAENVNGSYSLPKFSFDYSEKLNEVLQEMGMSTAFKPEADFSEMATTKTGMLFISRVIHNTFINVDEKGTVAGAATILGMTMSSVQDSKNVFFNRPFIFAIADNSTGLPLFIGAVYTV